MSLSQQFVETILGYDDNHRSTEDSRTRYFVIFNAADARPATIVRMVGTKLHTRPPCNQGELALARLVDKTLANMRIDPFTRYGKI